MMNRNLFQLLECPACHTPGSLVRVDNAQELQCLECKRSYPIAMGGIPSFAAESDIGFDERWRRHPAPQPTTADQWLAKTGIPLHELAGKIVLDAGCGIGRYCKFTSEYGAVPAGVDISQSGLAAARQNAPHAALIQASLTSIPIRSESIDIGFSIGVLHHLPDPRAGFKEVARTVKRGGKLAIWVYTLPTHDPKWKLCVDFLHEVTRACPPEKLYAIIEKYAVRIRDTYHPEWGPVQEIIRPAYNPLDEQCISDMFDWHTPQYRHYHTAEQVRSWFEEAGFTVEWTGSFPVSMMGIKR